MTDLKVCSECKTAIDVGASRCPACTARQSDAPGMHRDLGGRLLGGVAASVARQFGWDPAIVRVLWVVLASITGGALLWAYVALWVLTPFQAGGISPGQRFADWVGKVFGRSGESTPPTQSV